MTEKNIELQNKAIPEYILYKRAILYNSLKCSEIIANFSRTKFIRGNPSRSQFADFAQGVVQLYSILKPKFDKKELSNENIQRLDIFIKTCKNPPTPERFIEAFFILQNKIEEMGITEVEFIKQIDPENAVFDGVE